MIKHIVLFNLKSNTLNHFDHFAKITKETLSKIPGVQNLSIGLSIKLDARYKYLIIMEFADENLLKEYRAHPIHVKYRDEHFKPAIEEYISLDYELI
ncbi:MAG: Dabb family protein [archaeon]|nr:Dabb family protein [archaeon]MCP8319691.1 Dabb family protein [archaeon]